MIYVYRQVERKPRAACPGTSEAYVIRVRGDESAQLKNNKINIMHLCTPDPITC